ncbi:MAG: hypothetical protein AAFX99_19915, partial [Myxococcota bacterium]
MIAHPLLLAVTALDLLAVMFAQRVANEADSMDASSASCSALLVSGAQSRCAANQDRAAARANIESASLATRWAVGLFVFATALMVLGLTTVLPPLVPGAMCGTGVLSATEGLGSR